MHRRSGAPQSLWPGRFLGQQPGRRVLATEVDSIHGLLEGVETDLAKERRPDVRGVERRKLEQAARKGIIGLAGLIERLHRLDQRVSVRLQAGARSLDRALRRVDAGSEPTDVSERGSGAVDAKRAGSLTLESGEQGLS